MPTKTPDCPGCDGSGVRPYSTNHTRLPIPPGYVCVERCDTCCRYTCDWDAACAWGQDVCSMSQKSSGSIVFARRRANADLDRYNQFNQALHEFRGVVQRIENRLTVGPVDVRKEIVTLCQSLTDFTVPLRNYLYHLGPGQKEQQP